MATNKDIIPAQQNHLGVFIKDALDEKIKWKRLISLDIPVSQGAALDISAEHCIRLQSLYEKDLKPL